MVKDYPFEDWRDFFTAFSKKLDLNYDGKKFKFPKYEEALKNLTNFDIVKSLVEEYKQDPQIGLNYYISVLCQDIPENALSGYDPKIIDFFISFDNVTFPLYDIFSENDREMFECINDECHNYDIRARILDDFGFKLNLDVSRYADWKSIEEEHIDEQNVEGFDIDEDKMRFKHLKYISNYLKQFKK